MAGKVFVACHVPQGVRIAGVVINGPNFGKLQRASDPKYPMPGGYVLTEMDASDWYAWFKDNQRSELVTSNQVFADVSRDRLIGKCVGLRRTRSGLEQGVASGFKPY